MGVNEDLTKYPYGKEENDRIIALSDEEFEEEVINKVDNLETAEPIDLEFERKRSQEKYDYFRTVRDKIKEDSHFEIEGEKKEKDFASIAKQLVENPDQTEEIVGSLDSKMELNPLFKELSYARSFPKDIFGKDIDCEKYISDASSVIDIVLSNMDKDNFSYMPNYAKNEEYDIRYHLDCVDLGEILAYNPEQIDNILETQSGIGIAALEDTLSDMESYPEEWCTDDKNVGVYLTNISKVLTQIYEFERENEEKRKQKVNEQVVTEGEVTHLEKTDIESVEEKSVVIENEEETKETLPINVSKFAQIYGKAKGRIQEVFSKIKSFVKEKSQEKGNDNKDISGR